MYIIQFYSLDNLLSFFLSYIKRVTVLLFSLSSSAYETHFTIIFPCKRATMIKSLYHSIIIFSRLPENMHGNFVV